MLSSFIPICVAVGLLAFFWYGLVRPFGVQRDPHIQRLAREFTRAEQSPGMIQIRRAIDMPEQRRQEYQDLSRRLYAQHEEEVNRAISQHVAIPQAVDISPRASGRATATEQRLRQMQERFAGAATSVAEFGTSMRQAFSYSDGGVNLEVRPRRRHKLSPVEAWNS